MQKELVSIIIPVYQAKRYLERGIISALSQTYRPIEILLIDDGSTDGSEKICDQYGEKYSEIRTYHREHAGVSATRNFGIGQAKGKYIQFADADDEMKPKMIEKLVHAIEKEDAGMAACGYEVFNRKKCLKENITGGNRKIKCYKMNDIYEIVTSNLLSVTWNKLYIREQIRDLYDESMIICEDSVFCTRYFLNHPKVAVCPEILYRYYCNGNHMSEQRVFCYGDIKRYFSLNRSLVHLMSDEEKKKKARCHIAEVFFYGVYTYIFEALPNAKIGIKNKLAVLREVIGDKVYIHTIRRMKKLHFKEKCYRMASLCRNERLLYVAVLCRERMIGKER